MFCRSKLNYFLIISLFFAASCSDKKKEYDKAKAVSAFAIIDPIKVDPALEKVAINSPSQQENDSWNGSSAEQNQRFENAAKNFKTTKSWFSSVKNISLQESSLYWTGFGSTANDDFVFAPVIKNNKIYTLNAAGKMVAYDLSSGEKLWKSRVFASKFLKNYRSPKIYLADDKIFATAGVNKIAAVSAIDGQILWSKDIASIPVSAPVSDGEMVYFTTNDNKLYALNAKDGEIQWISSAIMRSTAIFGAADPVFYKDQIIAAFSSGEVYALKKKTGELLWSQELNVSKANSSDFYLNDIDATPVIKGNRMFVIGNGGVMMAIDLTNGNYLWRKEIAGIVDFWAAGDFLFVIDNDNKLLSVQQKSGAIKWISQLPNLEKDKKPESKLIYNGVVMMGDKLVISGTDGQLLIASPQDGKVENTFEIGKRIYHAPVVVNGKIYFHNMGSYVVNILEIQ